MRRHLLAAPPGALDLVDAEVVLHDDAGDACTITLRRGEMAVRAGRPRRPATEVSASRSVVVEVASGRRSGVEAFLDGDLVVSGNLALALGLDGLLDHPAPGRGPARFTRSDVVVADGIPTFHIEVGDPGAPPVVLLHGIGSTNASMLPTFHDLGADHRALAPDLPGHGATQAQRGRYDLAYFCSWLDDWMDRVGVPSAVLVGHSLGGRIALEMALRHPERVDGVVGLCPAVASSPVVRQLLPLVRLYRPEVAGLPVPLPLLERAVTASVRGLFAEPGNVPAVWRRAAAGEFSRCYRKPHRRVAFLSALRQVLVDDPFGRDGLWARLPSLAAPVLCVWGDRDHLVPAGHARHVSSALPRSGSVTFEGCGHVPQFEAPGRTSEVIRRFLADVEGGDAVADVVRNGRSGRRLRALPGGRSRGVADTPA